MNKDFTMEYELGNENIKVLEKDKQLVRNEIDML